MTKYIQKLEIKRNGENAHIFLYLKILTLLNNLWVRQEVTMTIMKHIVLTE